MAYTSFAVVDLETTETNLNMMKLYKLVLHLYVIIKYQELIIQ